MKSIINILNFVRGCEPRLDVDLSEVIRHQIEISEKYQFPTTFLLQYDAMIRQDFMDMFLPLDDKYEFGCWIEFNKPLMDKAGFPWRGREGWDWDYHTNVGFTPGYTPSQREILIDIQFNKFKELFGYYPKSIGSWVIDAHTLKYCQEKYNILACCICKDQFGTDGYTLWGGYFNQAYYPSVKNSYLPAQTKEKQINVPVFRMLGSDPMYQYECFIDGRKPDVISLEPVYGNAGADKNWCEWFFETNFKNDALGFAYTQAGQENSFGWELMGKGYTMQAELIDRYRKDGLLSVEKMSDSSKWFIDNYESTPVTTIQCPNDFENKGNKVYWYDSKYYRLNVKIQNGSIIVRDIHKFSEDYPEFCLDSSIDSHECKYNALPIYDMLNSHINKSFSEFIIKAPDMTVSEYILDKENNTASLKKGQFALTCYEDRIEISDKTPVEIIIKNPMYITDADSEKLSLFYEGYKYTVNIQCADVKYENKVLTLKGNSIKFIF